MTDAATGRLARVSGQTALDVANHHGRKDVVALLEERWVKVSKLILEGESLAVASSIPDHTGII